jgi:succinoglycan biosynthesis protein ExoW
VSARIGVIIPYFQREAGLLQRALTSVAAQDYAPAQVIVVDDGSPRAAEDDITPQLRAALPGLRVIRQANQGVAAARNTALDALASDITAVALLDSDDAWLPEHLKYAAACFAHGADFFFSNSRAEGASSDYFRDHTYREQLCNAPRADGVTPIANWTGGVSMLFAWGCAFHTSTVAYRRALAPDARFSRKFRRAGEDQLLFWELLVRATKVMFCMTPTLVSGRGGLGTWRNATLGTVAHLVRLADEIRLRRHVLANYPVGPADRKLMRGAVADRRYAALYSALHLLRRRREHAARELLYLLRSDPLCVPAWCIDLPRMLYRKMRGVPITAN